MTNNQVERSIGRAWVILSENWQEYCSPIFLLTISIKMWIVSVLNQYCIQYLFNVHPMFSPVDRYLSHLCSAKLDTVQAALRQY